MDDDQRSSAMTRIATHDLGLQAKWEKAEACEPYTKREEFQRLLAPVTSIRAAE
jgi:hypothetical protein